MTCTYSNRDPVAGRDAAFDLVGAGSCRGLSGCCFGCGVVRYVDACSAAGPVPEATARVARTTFPQGCVAMRLRDEFGVLYQEQDFVDLSARRTWREPGSEPKQIPPSSPGAVRPLAPGMPPVGHAGTRSSGGPAVSLRGGGHLVRCKGFPGCRGARAAVRFLRRSPTPRSGGSALGGM